MERVSGETGVPAGAFLQRLEEGSIRISLPAMQERFPGIFLAVFASVWLIAGASLAANGEAMGLIPLGIGLGIVWPALYWTIGRVEIILDADRIVWRRVLFGRGKMRELARSEIRGLESRVSVRTNGKPTSWSLYWLAGTRNISPALARMFPPTNTAFVERPPRVSLPGSYREPQVLWLGALLARWAGQEFSPELDRSVSNSD